jgi:HAD superfamily hydrolase (TIGR01509 family)
MSLKVLLLDFDGLVCDTERAAYRSWVEVYRDAGHDFPADVWARMCGRRGGEAVALADLSGRLGRPVGPAFAAARLARKRALAESEPARPGVPELLRGAARRGLRCAVVSSSARSWVDGHLHRLGLRDLLEDVVAGEDTARPKPSPEGYLTALRRAGTTAGEALAFEDSAVGVRAAKAAGLRCVAVPSAVGGRAEVAGADLVLDSLTDVDLTDLDLAVAG